MYFMMNNKEKHHFWKVDKCLFHFHVQVLLRALIEMLNCCVIAPPDPLNDQMGGTDIDGKWQATVDELTDELIDEWRLNSR